MAKKAVETPLMKQYYEMKAKHEDAILLFRVGDFYETFSDDAIRTSEILGITLTKRANGSAAYVELAGFPHHAIDTYLPKLVRAGQRVAICEQLEDPKKTKKLVKRGIIELVTPGVSLNDNVLEHKTNNFLASVHLSKKQAGISFLDISTGEFYTAEGTFEYIDKLLSNFQPKEVLHQRGKEKQFKELFGDSYFVYTQEDWVYTLQAANDRLTQHFNTSSLKGFGINSLTDGIIASGAILHYLDLTKHDHVGHITQLSRIEEDQYVWLDKFTVRNLELFGSHNEDATTLISILDKTISPMGARLLRRWVALPLKDISKINKRLNIVGCFKEQFELKSNIEENLAQIGDLERIISKVAVNRILPREVIQLKNALTCIKPIKEICLASDNENLHSIANLLDSCDAIRKKIENEILPEPSNHVSKGGVIANGIHEELDKLRNIAYSGKDFLAQMQKREIERTGIPTLKIAFNNVFGYYIEVRNTHKDKVPEDWIRKQTLVSAERYITEELKEYESQILGAEEKISALETEIFNALIVEISAYISAIQINAAQLAKIDCLLSFATIAQSNQYHCPIINESKDIKIKLGRHPVIEKQLPIGEEYIANDVFLDDKSQQIIIITGPNMAGKSALLRQTALIVLMGQIGSYVPAESAKFGYVDKIFTRVGASDNISSGESTFMVEMHEAASILNNLSSRSLILFDELGRGTSTYDGISIAWSIVEYIHEHPKHKAKTLFATHYHELNEMESDFKRIKNYNVSVKEIDDKVIFLRKLIKGGSNHSFGIHVAQMAGMPKSVVNRAHNILAQLENKNTSTHTEEQPVKQLAESQEEGYQLSIFQLDDPLLSNIKDEIQGLDLNNLTPIEALNKLSNIKSLLN